MPKDEKSADAGQINSESEAEAYFEIAFGEVAASATDPDDLRARCLKIWEAAVALNPEIKKHFGKRKRNAAITALVKPLEARASAKGKKKGRAEAKAEAMAEAKAEAEKQGKRTFSIDEPDLAYVCSEIEAIVAPREEIFMYAGVQHVIATAASGYRDEDDPDNPGRKRPMLVRRPVPATPHHWARSASPHVEFYKLSVRDMVTEPRPISERICTMLAKTAGALLPPITVFAPSPVALMNDDGLTYRIVSGNHYDRRTGVYVDCDPVGIVMPKNDREAYDLLRHEWLGDFPFDTEQDFWRAVCVAATLLAAPANLQGVAGPPLVVVSALDAETGKTYLLQTIYAAISGRELAIGQWPDDDLVEQKKLLLTIALEGEPLALFDNLKRGAFIKFPTVDAFITAPVWKGRILGVSRNGTALATTMIAYTGNDVAAGGDTESRALSIRLVVSGGSARGRNFDKPDPIGWSKENRRRILGAILHMLNHPPAEPVQGRMPAWFDKVGGRIQTAAGDDGEDLFADWTGEGETTGVPEASIAFSTLMRDMSAAGMTYPMDDNGIRWFTVGDLREISPAGLGVVVAEAQHRKNPSKSVSEYINDFPKLPERDITPTLRRANGTRGELDGKACRFRAEKRNLGERTHWKRQTVYGLDWLK